MSDTRGDIVRESARVVSIKGFAQEQYLLRLESPWCARKAKPGQFVALKCAEHLQLPRPYSVMRVDPENGQIEIYFRRVGKGSLALSQKAIGDSVQCLGPIGNGFSTAGDGDLPLLLGGGVGMPPILFLARTMMLAGSSPALVLLGSERPMPFPVCSSNLEIPDLPQECKATLQLLEKEKIPARLCAGHKIPGYYTGTAVAAADHWLSTLSSVAVAKVIIYACGPEPMLKAASVLAGRHGLRCELCVEEHMACCVGGCAGCAIPIFENGRIAMLRVCVEGPVFPAQAVYFDQTLGQRKH